MLKYVSLASPTPQTLPQIFVLFQHAVKRYGINVPTHFQLFSRTKGIAACNLKCAKTPKWTVKGDVYVSTSRAVLVDVVGWGIRQCPLSCTLFLDEMWALHVFDGHVVWYGRVVQYIV